MLQSKHMIKRRYFGLAAVFFVILAGVVYYGQTALADQLSPDTSDYDNRHAHYTLRYHESGSVLKIPLSVYTPVGVAPVADNNVNSFSISPTGLECKPSSNTNIKLEITVGGRRAYKHSLTHESCDQNKGADAVYKLYGLVAPSPTTGDGDWVKEESTNRWRADITLTLMDGDNEAQSWYNSDERKAFFHFRFNANGNLIVRNRTNNIDDGGDKRNYGVTQGKDYKINFAQPCSDESVRTVRAGMWDPDGFKDNKMRIQQRPRSGGEWKKTPLEPGSKGLGEELDNNFYQLDPGERSSAYFTFKMSQSMEYQLHYVTDPSNVVSLFWPNDSIQAEVDCSYELTPTTTLSRSRSISPGASINITSTVGNSNAARKPVGSWYVTKLTYNNTRPAGSIERMMQDNSTSPSPCANFGANVCEPLQEANNYSFTGSSDSRTFTLNTTNADIGKRFCYVTSVSPFIDAPRRTGNTWRHSNISCVIVAKSPKVHMLGADLRTTGKIGTSVTSDVGPNTYGSWMEYGIFSGGKNKVASSGAGLRGGYGNANSTAWSKLTFANKDAPGTSDYGEYGTLSASNPETYFDNLPPDTNLSSSPNPVSFPVNSGVYTVGNNATLSAGNITNEDTSVIIKSAGTVTIDGDISVKEAGYSDARRLSQIVIIAKDIRIKNGVGRVDAWLIGKDSINTCLEAPANALTDKICDNPLIINGPVSTKKLLLNRTAGANTDTLANAAEVFNLRPSVYIWAYNYTNKQDRARTTRVTELAPRL